MPVKGARLCGARCRTKGGAPCEQPAMKNGRCKMHGGHYYKREKHGGTTLRAIAERKREGVLLMEMKALCKEMEGLINGT